MTIITKTTKSGYTQFWDDETKRRVPSPSSITSRFKESGGLMHWANRMGLEGKTLDDARDEVVAPGHITHDRIDCSVHGREFDVSRWQARMVYDGLTDEQMDEAWEKADRAWGAFEEWREQSNLKVIKSEISLVSQTHRFGGTMDAVTVGSRLTISDWKTGNLYPDHLLQLGGYVILWEENMPKQPLDGVNLVSVSKESGVFTHTYIPRKVMQVAVDQFIALRECYDRDKALKKLM